MKRRHVSRCATTISRCSLAAGALWVIACGSEMAQHRRAEAPEAPWATRFCHDDPDGAAGEPFTLRSSQSGWALGDGNPDQDPALERVRINEATRSVCLDVPPPPSNENGGMCLMSMRSESDQGDRDRSGYIACNSELVSCKGSWADFTLVVPIINAVGLSHVCEPYVRHEDLWDAVQHAGGFAALGERLAKRQENAELERIAAEQHRALREAQQIAEARRAEEERLAALDAYRRQRALAKSPFDLVAFIERYSSDDPERLVPSARRDLHARLGEFQATLDAGAQTHCGLVVQVRRSDRGIAVEVETEVVGVHWFELDALMPSGVGQCRFVNNVYQTPTWL